MCIFSWLLWVPCEYQWHHCPERLTSQISCQSRVQWDIKFYSVSPFLLPDLLQSSRSVSITGKKHLTCTSGIVTRINDNTTKFRPLRRENNVYLRYTFIVVMIRRVLFGSAAWVRLIVRSFRSTWRPWTESHVPAWRQHAGILAKIHRILANAECSNKK